MAERSFQVPMPVPNLPLLKLFTIHWFPSVTQKRRLLKLCDVEPRKPET